MEYRSDSHRGVGLNDTKHQSTSHSGAILLAKLQQKVARLEVTLRDKEAEFIKVQSSLKNTHIHELKLQTEVYYQEILRLKNELNLLQETEVQDRLSPVEEPIIKSSRRFAFHNKLDSEPPNENKTLIKSIEKLKEENESLSCQLSSVQIEKERLESDFDKILRQAKEEELKRKRNTYTECTTQTSPRHNSTTITKSRESTENVLSDLKFQIEELQRKEKAWEEEKSMYKELILSLKEDRVFFKDTSQKRHDDLWALQRELVKLQKDIGGFQLNGKPLCKQCTKPSFRAVKSTKKIVKEASTPNASQVSSSQPSSSSVSADKPPKSKTNSVVSTKRLPTPQKTSRSEGSRSTVSKPPLSSTSSSRSSSAQSSPSHLPKKKVFQSSTKTSPVSSARSRSGENLSGGRSSEDGSSDRKSSVSTCASKRISSFSAPAPHPERKLEPEQKRVTSSSDSKKSPIHQAKIDLDQDEDEEIVREILRDLDFEEIVKGRTSSECHQLDLVDDETGNRDTGLPSSQSSPVADEEIHLKEEFPEESGCGDSEEAEQDELPDIGGVKFQPSDRAEAFLTLLECHFSRKKKLEALKPKQTEKSPEKTKALVKSTSKASLSKSLWKSPIKSPPKANVKPLVKSTTKPPTQVHRSKSTPKKIPTKPQAKVIERRELENEEEPQNLKDIDQMICLLESHVARNSFLSVRREK